MAATATATATATSTLVRSSATTPSLAEVQDEVLHHLDNEFGDLDTLLGRDGAGSTAGPSKRSKRRRNLSDEIAYWETQESQASAEVCS